MNLEGRTRVSRQPDREPNREIELERLLGFQESVIDAVAAGICVGEVDGTAELIRFSIWNRHMVEITGCPIDQMKCLRWSDARTLLSSSQQNAMVCFESIANGMESTNEEIEVVRPDGTTGLFRVSTRKLKANGCRQTFVALVQDVTNELEIRKALSESEKRFEFAVQATRLGLWDWNLADDEVYFSPEWKQQLGLRADDELSTFEEWSDRLHPEDKVGVLERLQRYLDDAEEEYAVEFRMRHTDGTYRWIQTRGEAKRDRSGKVLRMLGLHVDITKAKHNEDTLRTILRSVSSATGQTFFQRMVQFLARVCNVKIALVAELTPDQPESASTLAVFRDGEIVENFSYKLSGSPCEKVWDSGDLCSFDRALEQFPDDKLLGDFSAHFYMGIPLWSHSGAPVGLVALMNPVAPEDVQQQRSILRVLGARAGAELERLRAEKERERLEIQIQQTQKLESLGVLAGGIAHDFNNLLTSMMSYAEIARMSLPGEGTAATSIRELIKGIQSASELTSQMLAYAGKGKFDIRPINLSDLIGEISRLLSVSISKNCEMELRLDHELPVIEADIGQMRQLIMNLIINASEAIGDKKGSILVSTTQLELHGNEQFRNCAGEHLGPGNYVCIEVVDSGCGMDDETCQRVFDPFFTTKFSGRGLGMSAVLGIVRGHAGAITIETRPSEGATFRVLLPTLESVGKRVSNDAMDDTNVLLNGTVLVADDEAMVAKSTAVLLEKLGMKVETVFDGQRAIDLYKSNPTRFDLALVDLNMHPLSGSEVFIRLREVDPDAKIVLMSGYTQSAQDCRTICSAPFIQKPFRIKELKNVLQSVMATEQ